MGMETVKVLLIKDLIYRGILHKAGANLDLPKPTAERGAARGVMQILDGGLILPESVRKTKRRARQDRGDT